MSRLKVRRSLAKLLWKAEDQGALASAENVLIHLDNTPLNELLAALKLTVRPCPDCTSNGKPAKYKRADCPTCGGRGLRIGRQ